MSSIPAKRYLGDGVYVEFERGMLKLTAENGIHATDTIYLDDVVYAGLEHFEADVRLALLDAEEVAR